MHFSVQRVSKCSRNDLLNISILICRVRQPTLTRCAVSVMMSVAMDFYSMPAAAVSNAIDRRRPCTRSLDNNGCFVYWLRETAYKQSQFPLAR